MKTPYEILAVSKHSDDSEIKKAYLAKVRQHPPERDPELFQKIRQAYELIQSEEHRMSYSLFYSKMPDPVEIATVIMRRTAEKKIPTGKELAKSLAQDMHEFCVDLKF